MNATLEALKKFRTVEELAEGATVEAVPHHCYTSRFTYRVALPVAPKLAPKADLNFRAATKSEAIATGRAMTLMALRGLTIGLPGYGADTRRTARLVDFLAAESIDAAYEMATS